MYIPRVIPCLLFNGTGLVKTVQFKKPKYVGDPINAIRIFNDKEVDELIFLDITATAQDSPPAFEIIGKIASECFMPVCYGGGIRRIEDIEKILGLGMEKVSIGSYAVERPAFVREASAIFGSQSLVVCIDVAAKMSGRYEVVTHNGKRKRGMNPVEHAVRMEDMGAGEILVNAVDRDGTMAGYDMDLVRSIGENVSIPVTACGGAGSLKDIRDVIELAGASAGSAGSLFVFYGKHHAVLINYPERKDMEALFGET